MAENRVLVSVSAVRFFPACFSRQSLSMKCRTYFLCTCAQVRSQHPASAADVLIIPFSYFFFSKYLIFFFNFAFSFSCLFLFFLSASFGLSVFSLLLLERGNVVQ